MSIVFDPFGVCVCGEFILPPDRHYGYPFVSIAGSFYNAPQECLEKEFAEKGVKFVKHLNITDYQNKEFVIEDIDSRWLAFGLKIKN